MRRALMILFLLAAGSCWAAPIDANEAAARNVASLPAKMRPYVLYLDLSAVKPKSLPGWQRVVHTWAHFLSREATPAQTVLVTPTLLRINLEDFGIDTKVRDRLDVADPYFHVQVVRETITERVQHWPGGYEGGKYYAAGKYRVQQKTKVREAAVAPWLAKRDSATLAQLAGSRVPIVRGDWFVVQTSQQADRKGAGYYDFLDVKSRKDAEQLAGLDRKLAEKIQREVHAIIARSSVTLHNRQIRRYGTIAGAWWETRDADSNAGQSNALRFLNGAYKHQAEEIIFTTPLGLHGFFLGNAQGVRADSAPDNIASDGTALGTDRRVHAAVSCVRCHLEGIRPIRDWARRVYQNTTGLADIDQFQDRRNRRLYLSDLERWVQRDQKDYADALFRVSGLTPPQFARLFAQLHAEYEQADLGLEDIARETGYPVAMVRSAIAAVLKAKPPLDPVFAGLIARPPEPIRREHFEEGFPIIMTYLAGAVPANK